jgi:hypothetical protein
MAAGVTAGAIIASNAWISFSILRKAIADHGLDEGRAFASEIGPKLPQDSSVAVSSIVPYIHFSERLGRPLFVEFYRYDLSTSPPGPWTNRARNCTFVVTHSGDRLKDLANESGWKEVSRSQTGRYVLYRTDASPH